MATYRRAGGSAFWAAVLGLLSVADSAAQWTYQHAPYAARLDRPATGVEYSLRDVARSGDLVTAYVVGTGYARLTGEGAWQALPLPEITAIQRSAIADGAWYGVGNRVVTRVDLTTRAVEEFALPIAAESITLFEAHGNTLVGATSGNHLFFSRDGETWEVPAVAPSGRVLHIQHDPQSGVWVAITRRGMIWSAPDVGGPWVRTYASRSLRNVTFAGTSADGTFSFYIKDGINAATPRDLFVQSTDGYHWQATPLASPQVFDTLAYREGVYYGLRFVGGATTPAFVSTSSDGVTWTAPAAINAPVNTTAPLPHTTGWTALSVDNQRLYSTADFLAWQPVSDPLQPVPVLQALATNGLGTVVAAGRRILTSTDSGASWTDVTPSFVEAGAVVRDLVWDGQRFVGVGGGTLVTTSSDGLTWTDATPPAMAGADRLHSIATDGNTYVVAGALGVYTSTDLVGWTETRSIVGYTPGTAYLAQVSYANGRFFSTSLDLKVATSTDGTTWQVHAGGASTAGMQKVLFHNGVYFTHVGTTAVASTGSFTSWSALGVPFNTAGFFVADGTVYVRSTGNAFRALLSPVTTSELVPGLPVSLGGFAASATVGLGDRTFFATAGGAIASAEFTADPRGPGEVRLLITARSVEAATPGSPVATSFSVGVERFGGSQGAVDVALAIGAASTATLGSDFSSSDLQTSLQIPDGVMGQWVLGTFQSRVDAIAGASESVVLELSSLAGAPVATGGGSVTVDILAPAFDRWRLAVFGGDLSPATGPTADYDADGIANFVEFALGLDPQADDAALFAACFVPGANALDGHLEVLQTWNADPRIQVRVEGTTPSTFPTWTTLATGYYLGEGRGDIRHALDLQAQPGGTFLRPVMTFTPFAP